jgi:hypothetical protein
MRPPMPWFNLRAMHDADLVAIHRYLRSLGPRGEPAPAYVPPGGKGTADLFRPHHPDDGRDLRESSHAQPD